MKSKEQIEEALEEMHGARYYLSTYTGEHPRAKEIEGFDAAVSLMKKKLV